jgi:primosomal protein N'
VKSYFLAPIASRDAAITALKAALPEENKTWLLKDTAGDVMAYFYLAEPDKTMANGRLLLILVVATITKMPM